MMISLFITVTVFMVMLLNKDINYNLAKKKNFLASFFVMLSFLLMTKFEENPNKIEMMRTISLIAFFLSFEIYFFSATKYFGRDYYKQKIYWFLLNHNFIIILFIYLFIQSDNLYIKIYSMNDYVNLFRMKGGMFFFARSYCAIITTMYMLLMIVQLVRSFREYMKSFYQRIARISEFDRHVITELIMWFCVLMLIFLSEFSSSVMFHFIVVITIPLAELCSLADYFITSKKLLEMKLSKVQETNKVTVNNDNIQVKLEKWLRADPFPLLDSNINMDIVAQKLHIERQAFSDYIYKDLNTTFSSWVSDNRLEYCKYLLIEEDISLVDVVYKCGYADLPTMSKAFKKKYGVSPGKFKKGKDHECTAI